jgi:hypothetical protein
MIVEGNNSGNTGQKQSPDKLPVMWQTSLHEGFATSLLRKYPTVVQEACRRVGEVNVLQRAMSTPAVLLLHCHWLPGL